MKEDLSDLPVTIEEVSKLMGLRGFTDSSNDPAFASDALRIEVTGPTGLQLSVVDLPGLISVSNDEQSEEDIGTVHDMPDLINAGNEDKLAKTAKNQDSIKLKLGFFLLKNPSPAEMKALGAKLNRSELETQFFALPAWKAEDLDMARVGIENLKIFLQQLLYEHLEKELPKVKVEIQRVLASKEDELEAIGPERRSLGDIRSFMIHLSMRYYTLAQAALEGNYHSSDVHFFDKKNGTCLRSLIHQQHGQFAAPMRSRGHKRATVNDPNLEACKSSDDAKAQLIVTKDKMIMWIQQTYLQTRGRELPGNYSHVLLAELFHEQSGPWRRISEDHLSGFMDSVCEWVHQAASTLFSEDRLRGELAMTFQKRLKKFRTHAFEELRKILLDEERHPIMYNHYYTDNIQEARRDYHKSALNDAIHPMAPLKSRLDLKSSPDNYDSLVDAVQPKICVNMNHQACEEALAGLNAYYKVAMKTLIDNVCKQVVERHILVPLPGIFCPTTVSRFSDDDLLRIGSEPDTETNQRHKLVTETHGLQNSLVDLQGLLT
ncbi:dynamin family protein [Colletotrichum graminicola]|nr:dynamin family protein [Colletotrichum graminicola]